MVADVAMVELDELFDIALCSCLFNYARSRAELRTLVESVHRLLRPGGLVVGCNATLLPFAHNASQLRAIGGAD